MALPLLFTVVSFLQKCFPPPGTHTYMLFTIHVDFFFCISSIAPLYFNAALNWSLLVLFSMKKYEISAPPPDIKLFAVYVVRRLRTSENSVAKQKYICYNYNTTPPETEQRFLAHFVGLVLQAYLNTIHMQNIHLSLITFYFQGYAILVLALEDP